MNRRYLELRGAADVAQIRTATYKGVEHLVVPVVMLVGDITVRPMGSTGPEFVPLAELEKAPASWNGSPAVADHPLGADGSPLSANSPEILEAIALGQVFGVRVEDGRLKGEVYVDPVVAREQGGASEKLLRRLERHEMIEVSVGAWLTPIEQHGVAPDGTEYDVVWADIIPDHLALLSEGTGACSVDAGCGLPRAAHKETAVKQTVANYGPDALLARRAELRAAQESVSDSELRQRLWNALRADEPGFDGISEVFPDEGLVVYWTVPEDELLTWRRAYTLEDDGVALADDKEQVELDYTYKPVAAAAAVTDEPVPDKGTCKCRKGDDTMKDTTKALIEGLIACERTPFTADDFDHLAQFSEERLEALSASFAPPADPPPADPPSDPPAADPDTVQLSRDDYESMRAAAAAHRQQVEKEKRELIDELSKSDRVTKIHTVEALRAFDIPRLLEIKALAGLNEPRKRYDGQPVGDPTDDAVPAPPSLNDKITALRSAAN